MEGSIVLIGGTSHAGKSSLAKRLAQQRDARVLSTDTLARHPGRPWGVVRDHVREHYMTLTVDELIADVVRHYGTVWPQVLEAVDQHILQSDGGLLVVEGSAVLPHLAREVIQEGVSMVWITAPRSDLASRIRSESSYDHLPIEERRLVDKFIARTLVFDERVRSECAHHGLRLFENSNSHVASELAMAWIHGGASRG